MTTSKLWNLYSDNLKTYIFSFTKDMDLANDILQDTFLKLHLKQDELKKVENIKSWLYSVTKNTLVDYYRKNKIELPFKDNNTETEEPHQHGPEECLIPLIKKLDNKYKEPLLLCDIQGLKQNEAAQKLNITLSALKSRILRGRKLLQEGFMNCCDYQLDKNGKLVGELKSKEECKICR